MESRCLQHVFSYPLKCIFCVEKYREEGRQDAIINTMSQVNQKNTKKVHGKPGVGLTVKVAGLRSSGVEFEPLACC